MKILAIIVTYNGKEWYDKCFGSLLRSTVPVDIFVVDNASKDGTVEYIREKYPMINLVESDVNLGFGQANNKGFRYAIDNGYDYVFLLNQDAWLYSPDCIERLVEVAEKPEYQNYMILSPLWLYGTSDRISKGTLYHLTMMAERGNDFVSDIFFSKPLLDVYKTDYIGAAAWLISCQVLQTIGGFDPLFFHRGEDDNYMQRVFYHGGNIGICPTAMICHDIEERPIDYDSEHNDWKKNCLIDISNINGERTVAQWRKVYLLCTLKALLCGSLNRLRRYWRAYKFICVNERNINESVKRNKQIGSNWL